MEQLILGILAFSAVHLIPAALPEFRAKLVNKLSLAGYKVLYAVLSIAGFYFIIQGWQNAVPHYLYTLPGIVRTLMPLLMLVAVILFITSVYSTHIKQWVRHPQLTAIILFAIAHLLVNGDSRSIVLFGGLGLWALLEMALINKRDGQWIKGKPVDWAVDIAGICFALVVLVGIIHMHVYIAGVPLM